MGTIWAIGKREFASYFNSPIAYIAIAVFLERMRAVDGDFSAILKAVVIAIRIQHLTAQLNLPFVT